VQIVHFSTFLLQTRTLLGIPSEDKERGYWMQMLFIVSRNFAPKL